MALPINNSRPAIPYAPDQALPNSNRYSSLGQFPPTAQQLDGDLNALIDLINTLSDAINNTAAGIFPGADDPLNANKLATTDGAGNVSWTLINTANLDVSGVQTANIQDQAVTSGKIQVQAVGAHQLADSAVTTIKIADGAVTVNKIPNGSLPLSKLVLPVSACLIGGTTTGGGSWYPVTLGDWQIAAKKPQNNGPTAVSLVDVWSGTNGTFDGAKITPNTITGVQIAPQSVPLSDLVSSQQSCVIAGTPTNNAYYEVPLGDWQIAVKRAQDNAPTGRTLDVIWANTANTFDGSKLTGGSVPFTALASQQQPQSIAPFSMGYVLANGNLQKSFNIGSVTRTGTGYYTVRFATQANDNNYVVVFGAQDVGNNYFMTAEVVQNSRTLNGFDVGTGYASSSINGEFNFVVYAW